MYPTGEASGTNAPDLMKDAVNSIGLEDKLDKYVRKENFAGMKQATATNEVHVSSLAFALK